MTRAEFDDIYDISDLIDFCRDNGCEEFVEDVYTEYQRDEIINDDLVSMAREADDWQDLYNKLDNIPTGCDYYMWNGEDYEGFDDWDFENIKSQVLEYCEDNDVFEDEDDEDNEEEDDEGDDAPEDEDSVEEPCSLNELYSLSASSLQELKIA